MQTGRSWGRCLSLRIGGRGSAGGVPVFRLEECRRTPTVVGFDTPEKHRLLNQQVGSLE